MKRYEYYNHKEAAEVGYDTLYDLQEFQRKIDHLQSVWQLQGRYYKYKATALDAMRAVLAKEIENLTEWERNRYNTTDIRLEPDGNYLRVEFLQNKSKK